MDDDKQTRLIVELKAEVERLRTELDGLERAWRVEADRRTAAEDENERLRAHYEARIDNLMGPALERAEAEIERLKKTASNDA